MTDNTNLAEQIRNRYPAGLTGIFAIGGTRTTYILEKNRAENNPGKIQSFHDHGAFMQDRYMNFIQMFFGLGGHNMLITALSFRSFTERGSDHSSYMAEEMLRMTNDAFVAFYTEQNVDPYFVGIDTLLRLPETSAVHQSACRLKEFQERWDYRAGRRKLLWEIASVPLYSFWNLATKLSDTERQTIEAALATTDDPAEVHQSLYELFSKAVYGTSFPMPQFYLGSNRNGDLKWRSPMPIALSSEYVRMYFTPYPSLFITEATMRGIIEDLLFGKRLQSTSTDYSGRYTSEMIDSEYQRVLALSSDPQSTVGLSRNVP